MVAEKRKVCIRTNAHVIIEFGLKLLALMLKRDTLKASIYLSYLDPFVPMIIECLQSQHTEVSYSQSFYKIILHFLKILKIFSQKFLPFSC